jgi:AP-2 complex subunit alpha
MTKLNSCLTAIISTANEAVKNVQQSNAINCVLLEAINAAIHVDPDSDLVSRATALLCKYISSKGIFESTHEILDF